jgi:hypothetical protein
VASGRGAVDQPGAHEPSVQQQSHVTEPLAKQAQQQSRAPQLAAAAAAADRAQQQQRHGADGEVVPLDHCR